MVQDQGCRVCGQIFPSEILAIIEVFKLCLDVKYHHANTQSSGFEFTATDA